MNLQGFTPQSSACQQTGHCRSTPAVNTERKNMPAEQICIHVEGLKNACQGEYPQRRPATIPTEDYKLSIGSHGMPSSPSLLWKYVVWLEISHHFFHDANDSCIQHLSLCLRKVPLEKQLLLNTLRHSRMSFFVFTGYQNKCQKHQIMNASQGRFLFGFFSTLPAFQI